jgi:NitT/TauT family transport system substrate-binding protein
VSASSRRRFVASILATGAALAAGPLFVSCVATAVDGRPPLRVGLLPILEALPLWVAADQGIFAKRGIAVELALFSSAFERDAALQAGQLDFVLNDLVSAALLNKDTGKDDGVRVVRVAFKTYPALPMVSIVAGSGGRIQSIGDLRGQTLAISGNTVIEYVVDRLLERAGIQPGQVEKTEVTKLPIRVEMVTKGQVAAAALPEPLATLATLQGARRVADDGATGIGQSVLTARVEVLRGRGDDVRALLAAFADGIAAIKATPETHRALFVEKAKVPDALRDTLPFPEFPPNVVPQTGEVADVLAWARAKGLIADDAKPESLLDGSFLR